MLSPSNGVTDWTNDVTKQNTTIADNRVSASSTQPPQQRAEESAQGPSQLRSVSSYPFWHQLPQQAHPFHPQFADPSRESTGFSGAIYYPQRPDNFAPGIMAPLETSDGRPLRVPRASGNGAFLRAPYFDELGSDYARYCMLEGERQDVANEYWYRLRMYPELLQRRPDH